MIHGPFENLVKYHNVYYEDYRDTDYNNWGELSPFLP